MCVRRASKCNKSHKQNLVTEGKGKQKKRSVEGGVRINESKALADRRQKRKQQRDDSAFGFTLYRLRLAPVRTCADGQRIATPNRKDDFQKVTFGPWNR